MKFEVWEETVAQLLTLARDNRREFVRFARFSVVGVIGAVVDFGTFGLWHVVLGLPVLVAQALSFSAAVISNFLWNRYWTYPDSRSKPLAQQLGQFVIVSVISLAIRTPIIGLLNAPFGRLAVALGLTDLPLTPEEIGSYLALATAVVVVMF
ncbi:MAG: GtrA family protein, partial [Chloroflexi bacterium]|nr:GtrA family protein [Chloroflexota bacterium]